MNVRIPFVLSGALLLAIIGLTVTRRPAASPDVPPTTGARPAPRSTVGHGPTRPRLPAPRLPAVAGGSEAVEPPATNTIARLLKGEDVPTLTRAQWDTYLQQNKRSAESLLAASRATGDLTLLREAAANFPTDPRVQFDLAMRGETPEEKRRALDAFRQLAPDNPLGDYLSALDRFKSGHTDDAVRDLMQAGTKTKLQDYTRDHTQSAEEAYLSAGYGPLEAKIAGSYGVLLPHMPALRDLAKQMTELQKQYTQSGDAPSAQAVGQMKLNLAWQLEGQPGLIAELVGMAIEKKFLGAQSPDSVFGNDGRTVRDRLAELDAHRQSIQDLASLTDLLARLPEQEALIYFDRFKLNGELDALRWLKNKHGSP